MSTTFMNLDLPVVSTTLGPEWASNLNTALDLVDSHDHTSSKGKPVPVAGLDINGDLSFNDSYRAVDLFSTQYTSSSTPISGAGNANSVAVSGGDLWFTNGAGVAVQLTSGGSVVTSPGSVTSLEITSIAANLTISPSDTFVYIIVDTTVSRTITLPLASAVAAGRIFIVKDASGLSNTNPMTVARSGSDTIDGATSNTIDSNYATKWYVGDGVSKWYVS